MAGFADALKAELDSVSVVDPHSHLRPDRPQADTLADLVLYHHVWIELVSAGMPTTAATRAGLPHELADPGMAPEDRLKAALPYLPEIANTTCGWMLRTLLADLCGLPGGELTSANLDEALAAVAARAGHPGWPEQLLGERCGLEKTLTVEGSERTPSDPRVGRGLEQNLNLVSGRLGPRESLDALSRQLGRELTTAAQLAEAMHERGRALSARGLHFVGLWLLPHLRWLSPRDQEVTQVLARAAAGAALSPEELSAFTCFSLRHLLAGLRTGPVRTIQVLVGAEVLPPHRSLTHWSPEFTGALGRLAGEHEDFEFNCSSASDLYTQDLAVLAKHVPNISVAGYWWHTLYPFYLRKSLETRLDIVPASKITAFFSDAYHAEWIYPKLRLVKQVVGEVLGDRVARGLCSPDLALSLVRRLFRDNPRRIYHIA